MSEEASTHSRECDKDLEKVIRALLREHRYLHEFRLQKLIYLAELLASRYLGDTMTNASYKPYMHGSYSEDVADTLESVPEKDESVKTLPDFQHGKKTNRYVTPKEDLDDLDLNENQEKIINTVTKVTSSEKNTDLESWSKKTSLYNNTEYGKQMSFDKLEVEEFEKDVLEKFPRIKELEQELEE